MRFCERQVGFELQMQLDNLDLPGPSGADIMDPQNSFVSFGDQGDLFFGFSRQLAIHQQLLGRLLLPTSREHWPITWDMCAQRVDQLTEGAVILTER